MLGDGDEPAQQPPFRSIASRFPVEQAQLLDGDPGPADLLVVVAAASPASIRAQDLPVWRSWPRCSSRALLTMQRIASNDHGAVVESGTQLYAASRYSFEIHPLSS